MANLYKDLNKDFKTLQNTGSVVKGARVVYRILQETGSVIFIGFTAIKVIGFISTGILAPLGVGISAGAAQIVARQVAKGYMYLDKQDRRDVCAFLKSLGFSFTP
jgi:hypothetical protein